MSSLDERRARVPALQGGRQEAGQALLPVRDVPGHGHEPRRRGRDRRPRGRLEELRHPRAADRAEGRPGDDLLRPAARLVLLLPLLPAADLQVAGDGDPRPRSGSRRFCLVLLLALPFVDLRTERRLSRRPVAIVAAALSILSMGVLTYKGAVAKEPIASEVEAAIPSWAQKQGFAGNPEALAGAKLFAESGCTNCHTYLGSGGSNLGAPDLRAEGAKGKGVQFQIDHLKSPSLRQPRLADAALRRARRGQPAQARRLPRGLQGSEVGYGAMRVFLGITGASGAPYAARLLEALAAAGCEVGLCASRAGIEVLATELYGDARLSARRDARAPDRAACARRSPSTTSATGTRRTRAARRRSTAT